MCTCSWTLNSDGYELFFNRDEQRSRAQALAPQQFTENGTSFFMPVDPMGKGTWIASNHYGLSVCLLNYYQGQTPNGPLISRGLLVKQLASSQSVIEAEAIIKSLDLSRMAPFSLLVFDADLTESNGQVHGFQWNGSQLTSFQPKSPMISSGIDFENVVEARLASYSRSQSPLEFHCHRDEISGHLGVCMHREDAKTVSLTYISVSPESKYMNYYAGSPSKQKENINLKQAQYVIKPMRDLAYV